MTSQPTEGSKHRIAIVWFRNDLRLNDNLSLNQAIDLQFKKKIDSFIPFYCFDKLLFEGESRQAKLPRLGPFRRNFLIESVENLRENMKTKLKSQLYLSYGDPIVELTKLIDEIKSTYKEDVVSMVIGMKEIASEETDMEVDLEKKLKERNVSLSLVWDQTMIHLDDLPYDSLTKMPDVFTHFRKNVEQRGESNYDVRKCITIPPKENFELLTYSKLATWPEQIPTKATFNLTEESAIKDMNGGETEAIKRTINYFFKSEGLFKYKTTRNGLIGKEYSSKLSMWMAHGCISARYLYWKVKDFEAQRKPNESTKAFVFELLWRDFFKFHSYKHGKRLFLLHGCFTSSASSYNYNKWRKDKVLFEKWCNGETGYPFVDANMKELNATGWMSNRGRQNVASFLTKDMEIDWRWGAEYFEQMLIDYDTTSNWGNWQYAAGVGTDPRDRIFNVIKQGYDYDENGDYVRMWLPTLAKVPTLYVHCPFMMSLSDQKRLNCQIGKDYSEPIVKAKTQWHPSGPRRVNKFAEKSKNSK